MVSIFILHQDTSIFDAPAIVLCDMKKMEKSFAKDHVTKRILAKQKEK